MGTKAVPRPWFRIGTADGFSAEEATELMRSADRMLLTAALAEI